MAVALPAWQVRTASSIAAFLPRLSAPALLDSSTYGSVWMRRLSHPLLPIISAAVPVSAAIRLNIPGLLSDIWEAILRAVPKKKTSHMKKRHRQMAGKALKDVTAICKCPACGEIKRMHVLCPNCTRSMCRSGQCNEKTELTRGVEMQGIFREDMRRQRQSEQGLEPSQ